WLRRARARTVIRSSAARRRGASRVPSSAPRRSPESMIRWPPPPRVGASFFKAHGHGNDYIVFDEGDRWQATPERVAAVCDPHRGVGSDGIVVLLRDRTDEVWRARMFNPDGSEFERSGNGLRVLAARLARLEPTRARFVVEV